jgi:hypothetical protein
MVTYSECEYAVAGFFSTLLGVTLGDNFFIGELPDTVTKGLMIDLDNELVSLNVIDNGKGYREFTLSLVGKFDDIDTAYMYLEKVENKFPLYGVDVILNNKTVEIMSIIEQAVNGVEVYYDDGDKIFVISNRYVTKIKNK